MVSSNSDNFGNFSSKRSKSSGNYIDTEDKDVNKKESELDEKIKNSIKAGKILKQVKKEAAKMIKPGVKLIEIAEFVETKTIELGAFPAFPCNISINSDAAHFTPKRDDERVFKEGDIVKLDIGTHIGGFVADSAVTVDLGSGIELAEVAEKALENAISVVRDGVDTSKIGEVIEETILSYGYKPIYNLTGHGLERWIAHAPPTIYNYKTKKGVKLKEGMIIAIEPFVTNGAGKVTDRNEVEIFSLPVGFNERVIRSVRMKQAKEILKEATKYKTLPFAKRWLKKAPEIIISKLVREGHLMAYPVLTEVGKGLVSQQEHTLIVEKDSAKVIT